MCGEQTCFSISMCIEYKNCLIDKQSFDERHLDPRSCLN